MSAALCLYLVRFVPQQTELAGDLAAGELAAVEVHAPGAAEGEGGAAGLGVQTLAGARTTGEQRSRRGRSGEAGRIGEQVFRGSNMPTDGSRSVFPNIRGRGPDLELPDDIGQLRMTS